MVKSCNSKNNMNAFQFFFTSFQNKCLKQKNIQNMVVKLNQINSMANMNPRVVKDMNYQDERIIRNIIYVISNVEEKKYYSLALSTCIVL